MPAIIEYIIKLSVCLAITFLFYRLLLSRLTFYNWNRWYLLGYSLLSFVIPVIDIMPSLQKRNLQEGVFIQWIPSINTALQAPTATAKSWDIWQVVIAALITGVLFFTLRFAIRLFSLYRLKKSSTRLTDTPVKIYQVNKPISPFSFGTSMYIHTPHHSNSELQEIIRHEFVHIKQLHSIDIILVEILCIINWFNPFAWLIKKAVKQNLEFIADRKMLEKCSSKKQYQYLLLKVMGNTQFSFANNFNFTSLKKRIAMMNKNKTAQIHLSRFLFLLPVISVSLLSFRSLNQQPASPEDKKTEITPKSIFFNKQIDNKVVEILPPNTSTINTPQKPKIALVEISTDQNNPELFKDTSQLPLILLNGIAIDRIILEAINPEIIESISILKDEAAIAIFGKKGEKGIILIETKRGRYNYNKLFDQNFYIRNIQEKENKNIDNILIDSTDKNTIAQDSKLSSSSLNTFDIYQSDKFINQNNIFTIKPIDPNILSAYKKNIPENTVILLNDKEISPDEMAFFLATQSDENAKRIRFKMDKNEASIAKYGKRAQNGIFSITLKY